MARDTDAEKMILSGARVLVVGGARTGLSTARFLAARGAHVTLTDMATLADRKADIRQLSDLGVALELGIHKNETFLGSDLIVVSPGVALFIEPLVAARDRGVRIIGELELASRFIAAPIVAVTGTNGKTTTTALLGDILTACGKNVLVGGNIGTPLIDFVNNGDAVGGTARPVDYVVAEISSFQLEAVETFRPRVSVLLNITPDHLDRYRSYEEYIAAKLAIFVNQTRDDSAVLNRDDELVVGRTKGILARKIFFSRRQVEHGGVSFNGKEIVSLIEGRSESYDVAGSRLTGVHNIENIMAALAAAAAVGCGGRARLAPSGILSRTHTVSSTS